MGCYINPPHMSKEQWLKENALATPGPTAITDTHLPVCLVNNRGYGFTAAAVAYDEGELQAFQQPDDTRLKMWFRVERARLYEVSDLHRFLPRTV